MLSNVAVVRPQGGAVGLALSCRFVACPVVLCHANSLLWLSPP